VGATCGNVTTILSWLGNRVFPVAHFDMSEEGLKLSDDLRRYGCDCRFVRNDANGGVTTLLCTHRQNKDGSHKVAFRRGSPGGSMFPKHKIIRARDEAPELLGALDFTPDVFFFDDQAAGNRVLAKGVRERGTLVYFEPEHWNGVNTEMECIKLSDIVKFSGEKIPDTSFTEVFPDKLFIQTLGADGIRFKIGGNGWVTVPPVPCEKVVDWEGAGDWTSATFIDFLCRNGCPAVKDMTEDLVRKGLEEAQAYASKSVGFLGSKGMIHAQMGGQ